MKIRNIRSVYWSDPADAPHQISHDTLYIAPSTLNEIPIKPFAKLEISEKVDVQRQYIAKLTFKTTDDTLTSLDRKVFYALDVDRHVWVLGSQTRPYPVVTRAVALPESGEDSQLNTFQVDYTTIFPILYKPAT